MEETLPSSFTLVPEEQDLAWAQMISWIQNTDAIAIPQSTLCYGPEGVGKKRTVKALFQALHCEGNREQSKMNPCGTCVLCKRIYLNHHADWIEITNKNSDAKDVITVDQIREIKPYAYFQPIEGKLRFIVIDHAEKLSNSASNALLKFLEEPPQHTRFFLIAKDKANLLQTIQSRSQSVRFSPMSSSWLREFAKKNSIELPLKYQNSIFEITGGSSKNLLDIQKLPNHLLTTSLPTVEDLAPVFERDQGSSFLDFIITSSTLRAKELLTENVSHLQKIKSAQIEKLVAIIEDLHKLRSLLDMHSNKKLIATACYFLLKERQNVIAD